MWNSHFHCVCVCLRLVCLYLFIFLNGAFMRNPFSVDSQLRRCSKTVYERLAWKLPFEAYLPLGSYRARFTLIGPANTVLIHIL